MAMVSRLCPSGAPGTSPAAAAGAVQPLDGTRLPRQARASSSQVPAHRKRVHQWFSDQGMQKHLWLPQRNTKVSVLPSGTQSWAFVPGGAAGNPLRRLGSEERRILFGFCVTQSLW